MIPDVEWPECPPPEDEEVFECLDCGCIVDAFEACACDDDDTEDDR